MELQVLGLMEQKRKKNDSVQGWRLVQQLSSPQGVSLNKDLLSLF